MQRCGNICKTTLTNSFSHGNSGLKGHLSATRYLSEFVARDCA